MVMLRSLGMIEGNGVWRMLELSSGIQRTRKSRSLLYVWRFILFHLACRNEEIVLLVDTHLNK
jgi:hypothetical protein